MFFICDYKSVNTDDWVWGTIDSNGDGNSGTSFTPKNNFLTIDLKFLFFFLFILFLTSVLIFFIIKKIKK